jgi:bifunctional UDP-N-acetylglucosamine pyrophosphorylase/glucosamine-1-phosphate N-acetyltransferase
MLDYTLEAVAAACPGTRPLIVVSPATEAIRVACAGRADFALQAEPIGSGDAVRAALAAPAATPGAGPHADEVLVVNGDVPLVGAEVLAGVLAARREAAAALAIVAVEMFEPGRLGRVVRGEDGSVERIVEAKDATIDELAIDEINAGFYAFDGAWLRRRIGDLRPSPATGEYYLTDLVAFARDDGRAVAAHSVADDGTLAGINDRAELAEATAILRERINLRWLRAGVTMLDPATAFVDATVELDRDVVLEPNVTLRGATRVGEGTIVGSGSQLIDSVVGAGCRIRASVLERAVLADGAVVGPFLHLGAGTRRPGSQPAEAAVDGLAPAEPAADPPAPEPSRTGVTG